MVYYDRTGKRIGLLEWARLHEDIEYKRVALTDVGHYRVSTVWLGINHNFGQGPPIIFETMIFDTSKQTVSIITGESYPEDVGQDRYSTEVAALAGHDQAVAWCREHASV